ncbi:MAG TPA: TIGR02221 family CRISPR-associated protein [Syntrophobacteraceae bacterium]|nr:TIGR02221 family CRISPR-associated protein [Syntrophobacteraceae bacterium]
MANIYVSFLGTNDYLECIYCGDGLEPVGPVRFVQQATIKNNCSTWGADDRILIFTTEEAERKNWLDNGHRNKEGKILERKGLRCCIGKMELSVPHENVTIPEGYSEDEIWQIFKRLNDCLCPGDNVVFDITHALRSIPLVAVVVLNYAKALKHVSLRGIYYGAFEALGSYDQVKAMEVESRKVRILDLTALDQLMDWTVATHRFLESGDARMAGALAAASVRSILKETRGKDREADTIRKLGTELHRFSDMLSTCRGQEITAVAAALKEQVQQCRGLDLLPPFRPLFDTIEKRLEKFAGDDLRQGLTAVRWCLDHGLIQQGFTFLEELLFSYVVLGVGADPLDTTLRDVASQAFTLVNRKWDDTPEQWYSPAKDHPDTTRRMIGFIQAQGNLCQEVEKVRSARNDLNHAGFCRNCIRARDGRRFGEKLRSSLDAVEKLFEGDPSHRA